MAIEILRPHFLTFRNRLSHGEAAYYARKRFLLISIVALLLVGCIYECTALIFHFVRTDIIFLAIVPLKILELGFSAFFVLLIISNTIAAIGNFYTAERMVTLFAAPLSGFRLYSAKFLETYFETGSMYFVLVTPVLVAYVTKLHVSPSFLFVAILLSFPFLAIPVGIGVVFATAFMKLSAYFWKGGRFLYWFLGLLFLGSGVEFLHLADQFHQRHGSAGTIVEMLGFFDNPNPWWTPARWISELAQTFLGHPANILFNLGLLILTALFSFSIGFIVVERWGLHVRSVAGTFSKERDHARPTVFLSAIFQILWKIFYAPLGLSLQERAIILKDLRSLVRDRAQSLQLLMYSGIALGYIVMFRIMTTAVSLNDTGQQLWWACLASLNVLFAGLILTTVMTRLVYPSLSLEGKAFWLLVVSPLDLPHLLRAKFATWLPLSMIVVTSLMLAGAAAIQASTATILCSIIIGISLSIGLTGIALGLGALFATFEWESPNQIATSLGTLMLLLMSILISILNSIPATALLLLVIVDQLRINLGHWLSFGIMILSIFSIIFFNILVARYFCRRGAAALLQRFRA